ncbi:MAG: tetratricopeptide repeat protein [Streptosporangiaceae bacterium]
MTTREDAQDSWGVPARRQPHDQAYFLNLLGDSHTGLGRHEAAIEAYRQAAEEFKSQGAHCSYALCLWKVAESHLSLGEPWHALGYLEASLPLLHELGLTRHEALAREQLAHCQSELAGARLLGEGRADRRPSAKLSRPGPRGPGQRERCRPTGATRVELFAHPACRRWRKHVLAPTLGG